MHALRTLGHKLTRAPFPAEAGGVWQSERDGLLGTVVTVRERPWYAGTSLAWRAEMALERPCGDVVRVWYGEGATLEEAEAALRADIRGSMLGAAA